MTLEEFSNEFDIMYNNITSNQAPGLNLYEKSVFLTQVQEDVIIQLYNGKLNGEAVDSTEEVRQYVEPLIKQEVLSDSSKYSGGTNLKIDSSSTFYKLPADLLYIIYESVTFNDSTLGCKSDSVAMVTPIPVDDFYRANKNPFKGPSDRRVLRLIINHVDTTSSQESKKLQKIAELVSKYNIDSYLVRYISKPTPIILTDFSSDSEDSGLSIDGMSQKTICMLDPILHRTVLEKAVTLAKAVWAA